MLLMEMPRSTTIRFLMRAVEKDSWSRPADVALSEVTFISCQSPAVITVKEIEATIYDTFMLLRVGSCKTIMQLLKVHVESTIQESCTYKNHTFTNSKALRGPPISSSTADIVDSKCLFFSIHSSHKKTTFWSLARPSPFQDRHLKMGENISCILENDIVYMCMSYFNLVVQIVM